MKLEEILKLAKDMGASDVHLTVGVSPRARVNGRLLAMDQPRLLAGDTLELLISLMPESRRLRFDEEGEYEMGFSVPELGRFRVNAYRQSGMIAMAVRLLPLALPSSEELGIPEEVLGLGRLQRGLVLIGGPAGSGVTTTIAAIIDGINNDCHEHIITIEKPIEYVHQHRSSFLEQREVGVDSESFAAALCSARHQDPDVIMLSALEDPETIEGAVAAAEAGRLVIAAVHGTDADEIPERLAAVFSPHEQQRMRERLLRVLEAVVFQRMTYSEDGAGRTPVFQVLISDRK